MARTAGGWKLRWRGGVGYVRFTHGGKPYSLSTGKRDPGEASATAARIYSEVVGGEVRRPRGPVLASRTELGPLTAEWIADLEATHTKRTAQEYDWIATREWLTRWQTLGEITTQAIGDYQRARLREVTRETTRKHRVALATFLAWCKETGALAAVPELPDLPERATGVRVRQATKRIPMTPAEAERLIARLPVWGTKSPRHPRFRVRDWATLAWDTALRPATLARLSVPEHFRPGARGLDISADIDKARWARTVPLSARALATLRRIATDVGLIFGSHDYRALLAETSSRVLGRVVRPYDFRHSRITAWLREGKDLVGVQYLVGHLDLSTTSNYTHATEDAARTVVGR